MRGKHIIFLSVILMCFCTQLYADITTEGQDFWLTFAKNGDSEDGSKSLDLSVLVVASANATVTATNEATGWKQSVEVKSTSPGTISIPSTECYVTQGGEINKKGIHITSSQPVSLYVFNDSHESLDGSLVLPTTTLGTDYVVQTYDGTSRYSAYAVFVATEDVTAAVITPSADLADGAKAGTPFVITMSKGETYAVFAKGNKSLSGTRISANKPIAVFNGNISTQIPDNYKGTNHTMEIAYPTRTWGSKFIVPSVSEHSSVIRFTALTANTTIKMDGNLIATLDAKETYQYVLLPSQTSSYIESSGPIACYMYLTSNSYNTVATGAPSMMWIAPLEQLTSGCTFCTAHDYGYITDHYLHLVAPTNSIESITLDGKAIGHNFQVAAGDKHYSYCQMKIFAGQHTLHSDEGITGYVYGLGEESSYAMGAASTAKIINDGEHVFERIEVDIKEQICKGGSYKFGDNILTEPGNYTHTFQTHDNRDSIVHLTLWLLEPKTADIYDFLCEGGIVEWDGRTYSAAGEYQYTYTTADGCDSIVTLHVEESPLLINNIDTMVCGGEPFVWNGQQYTVPDTYQQTFVSRYGCDSIVNLTLGFYTPLTTTLDEEICEGGSFVFGGKELKQTGIYKDTLPDIHGCDSIVVLNLTVNDNERTDLYDKICNGGRYYFENEVILKAGDYEYHYNSQHGCDSVVYLHLKEVESYGETVTDVYICEGDSYQWLGETFTDSARYTFNLTTANGCDSIVTLALHYYPATDTTHLTDTITLGQTYTWNGETYTTAGYYRQILTNQNGCDSVVELHLVVNDLHVNRYSIEPICADDKVLTIELDLEGGWYDLLTFSFDPAALAAGWQNDTISLYSSRNIDLLVPSTGVRAGRFNVELTLWFKGKKVVTMPIDFEIHYPSWIIEQVWDDVLAVLNDKYNGGYHFTAFQWYRNGEPIEGATRSYLNCDLNNGDEYTVNLTDSTGMQQTTCPHTVEVTGTKPLLAPTLLLPRQSIKVSYPGQIAVSIINVNGVLYSTCQLSEEGGTIEAPAERGIYVVMVRDLNGAIVAREKIVVR